MSKFNWLFLPNMPSIWPCLITSTALILVCVTSSVAWIIRCPPRYNCQMYQKIQETQLKLSFFKKKKKPHKFVPNIAFSRQQRKGFFPKVRIGHSSVQTLWCLFISLIIKSKKTFEALQDMLLAAFSSLISLARCSPPPRPPPPLLLTSLFSQIYITSFRSLLKLHETLSNRYLKSQLPFTFPTSHFSVNTYYLVTNIMYLVFLSPEFKFHEGIFAFC